MNIKDGDHELVDGRAWFSIKGFSIHIYETDEGIAVDTYHRGRELEDPITRSFAYNDQTYSLLKSLEGLLEKVDFKPEKVAPKKTKERKK